MGRTWFALVCGGVALLLVGCDPGGLPARGGDTGHGGGAHGSKVEIKTLSAEDVTELVDGKEAKATTLEVTFGPGAGSPPHRHPGPVFGYVLEGAFETQLGDGPVRLLKAGETFYEPTMVLHAVSRNPSDKEPTRILAVLVHPRDVKELVIPEPAEGKKDR